MIDDDLLIKQKIIKPEERRAFVITQPGAEFVYHLIMSVNDEWKHREETFTSERHL